MTSANVAAVGILKRQTDAIERRLAEAEGNDPRLAQLRELLRIATARVTNAGEADLQEAIADERRAIAKLVQHVNQ